jgi:hypothetical protein
VRHQCRQNTSKCGVREDISRGNRICKKTGQLPEDCEAIDEAIFRGMDETGGISLGV